MREKERIHNILGFIQHVWESHPDLRLGQVASILKIGDDFYLEDDEYLGKMNQKMVDSQLEFGVNYKPRGIVIAHHIGDLHPKHAGKGQYYFVFDEELGRFVMSGSPSIWYDVCIVYTDPGFQLYECFDDGSIKQLTDKEFLRNYITAE